MAINMRRAFNARMLTKIDRYFLADGEFDEFNEWQEGRNTKSTIHGVITSGNRFSQFGRGISLKSTAGGERFSDYKSLYISDRFALELGDMIGYKGKYYNVLQETEEDTYGFRGFLIEKDKDWEPV